MISMARSGAGQMATFEFYKTKICLKFPQNLMNLNLTLRICTTYYKTWN